MAISPSGNVGALGLIGSSSLGVSGAGVGVGVGSGSGSGDGSGIGALVFNITPSCNNSSISFNSLLKQDIFKCIELIFVYPLNVLNFAY